MDRATILTTASELITKDREHQYGSPKDNLGTIAELWHTYLTGSKNDGKITAHDVAVMMCLVKIARIASGNVKADSYTDLCGYGAIAGELAGDSE